MIDVGQNDLLEALYASNLTYAPVAAQIPSFIAETKLAVQVSISWFHFVFDTNVFYDEWRSFCVEPRIYTSLVGESFGYIALDHRAVLLKSLHYMHTMIPTLTGLDAFVSTMIWPNCLTKGYAACAKSWDQNWKMQPSFMWMFTPSNTICLPRLQNMVGKGDQLILEFIC